MRRRSHARQPGTRGMCLRESGHARPVSDTPTGCLCSMLIKPGEILTAIYVPAEQGKEGPTVVERSYRRITGASTTAPTSYRGFKPYVYRGAEPWNPKPREGDCTKTGEPATNASYRLHYRNGEKPCNACRTVNALSSRRSAQKQRTGIICDAPEPCSAEGYAWHQHQGEPPCPECTRYHQKENQK